MVSVTLEELWMVSDRIIDFQFFFKFLRSGPAIIFSFLTLTEHVNYASKKLLIHSSGPATIFSFELSQNMLVMHQKVPNQATDLINMLSVTIEGLWMVSV